MTSDATKTTKALPPRRAAFAREYLVDLNASRAARDAGYAPKSASVEGSRLLADADVQAEITRQRAILIEESNVTPERIVAELAVIAFSDLGDYIRIHRGGIASIDLDDMSPGATRAIASLNTDSTSAATGKESTKLRIKLHDKHAALVSLAKMFGLLTGDSPGVSVVVNQAESVELATLSTAELRRGVELLALSEGENPRELAPNEAVSSDQPQETPT
ncbi:terminase small subunit [SAR202 cluster bacterium AD-812-D07_MRT_10900m]|nr:terminase small subunit [SAR202 cluster bacterium AD-812-D07_MRT_10900m]